MADEGLERAHSLVETLARGFELMADQYETEDEDD
jgi:hypothetical protein